MDDRAYDLLTTMVRDNKRDQDRRMEALAAKMDSNHKVLMDALEEINKGRWRLGGALAVISAICTLGFEVLISVFHRNQT